ncbi:MAG TPA: glycoside hydrolase family 2 TIM barrel-domain containing protein [Puia sp.]
MAAGLMSSSLFSQADLITNIDGRNSFSLDGQWQYIVDPYETGIYDYRHKELPQNNPSAYWNPDQPASKMDRKEYGYTEQSSLKVPGDWNSQRPEFLYYEGTVWYKKSFDFRKSKSSGKLFLYFAAVNYRADVYLNGRKLGIHEGGFTPFDFEIPDSLIKERGNFLVVRVDNKRSAEGVPTLNTDWWNYGGITRSVKIIELPPAAIRDYFIQLKPKSGSSGMVEGWVKLDSLIAGDKISIEIPALRLLKIFPVKDKKVPVHFTLPSFEPWSPEKPVCYRVIIRNGTDRVEEKIGFRTIETKDRKILLNGKPVFLRGVCIHEEIPQQGRRAYSREDALQLLGWAKELNCNMVRLAHYPHDESMTRAADSLGILVWSEIPVYWTIDFSDSNVLKNAERQLTEEITRDHNRSAVIIWSVGNETPVSETRTAFMKALVDSARILDPDRLLTAALEVNYRSGKEQSRMVDDPLGEYLDLISFNEYLGWYGGTPESCRTASWGTKYNKPLFISETGAGALGGFHADTLTVWSEEYQAWYFKEQTQMMERMPDGFSGVSPWILADFRSPRRNNPVYQQGWNRKGLIGQDGNKKQAFFILKHYYDVMEKAHK